MSIKIYVFFLFLILLNTANTQSVSSRVENAEAPFKKVKKSKVMILGTFHFRDGGHDSYKPKYSVNIKSEKRQKEVSELLQMLAKFKPTKVAIENMPVHQKFHDSLYTEFVNNRYKPGENEIYQICYRLAGMMKHKQVFTIDAPARDYEKIIDADSFAIANQIKYKDSVYGKLFFSLYSKEDSLKSVWPLKEILAYHNNPERLRLGLGHYLIDDFKVSGKEYYPGADGATYWWNRNLRIFSNIVRLATESTDERIFVMIGAGHLPILRFIAMACPEIEFVDAYDYLTKK